MPHLIDPSSSEILEGILDFKGHTWLSEDHEKGLWGLPYPNPNLLFIFNQSFLILFNSVLKSSEKFPFLYAT
jgi:hypothetical protein